ncbi:MAG: type II secretion system protein GspG [Acidobacteriota bacterium]
MKLGGGAGLGLLVAAAMVAVGLLFPLQATWTLLTGWVSHLRRVVPGLDPSPASFMLPLACLVGTCLLGHRLLAWAWAACRSNDEATSEWRWVTSLRVVALVLLLVVTSLATTAIGHQCGWLIRDRAELIEAFVSQRSRAHYTEGALRTMSSAIELRALDEGGPPRYSGPVSDLERLLTPSYIKEVTVKDAWGGDLLYESDGVSYELRSLGKDGRPSGPDEGLLTDYRHDIIFRDGEFVTWRER